MGEINKAQLRSDSIQPFGRTPSWDERVTDGGARPVRGTPFRTPKYCFSGVGQDRSARSTLCLLSLDDLASPKCVPIRQANEPTAWVAAFNDFGITAASLEFM